MGASQTITLFSSIPATGQRSSSFLLSILMHGFAAGLVYTGIVLSPRLSPPQLAAQHYSIRQLDLHTPKPRQASGGSVGYPGPVSHLAHLAQSRSPAPGAATHTPAPPLPRTADAVRGPQTLVQPDVHKQVALTEKIPLPNVVIWSPEKAPVKTIVPPHPQPPTASDVTPSISPPNEEVNLADLGISATDAPVQDPLIQASTTSPVVVHAPDLLQMPPVTTSDSTAQPTPATVLSLSDLRMEEGTVTLVPANETASTSAPGSLAPGQAQNAAPQANAGGAGARTAGQDAAQGTPTPGAGSSAGEALAGRGQNPGAGSGPGAPSATIIQLPHDGEFGSVVVGDSVSSQYPDLPSQWASRMAYTVYLHVGLTRSWILQYSLPAAAEASAAGQVVRIEAPWPYNIVRPDIPSGSVDADALMVHGFVNQSGRFDSLSVAFPADYAQAQFLLGSLLQWQFRPAAQNGQPVRVEVMLIIPQQND
jgi:hypothetical protein